MTTIIGLDGETREWDAAFANQTAGAGCSHGLATISGFILRRWDTDATQQYDAAQFDGANQYGAAIAAKRIAQAECWAGGWALIDTLYECGCRGQA